MISSAKQMIYSSTQAIEGTFELQNELNPAIIYAIGDVHGRSDLLETMLSTLKADAGNSAYQIIFLGDIIDHGPGSRQAMELVCQTLNEIPGSRLIVGNHEEFLLRIIACTEESDRLLSQWMHHGGAETLRSYKFLGYENAGLIADELEHQFPHHLSALRSAENMVIQGKYAFVHAGIKPGVALDRQDTRDLRWIRDEFLSYEGDHGHIIVHGHTITKTLMPEHHGYRINLDSGAYHSGVLSALKITNNGNTESFITVTLNE